MKTIKQIREEYDTIQLNQVHDVPDELMLEGRESVVKHSGKAVPSPANMPAMLLFRRVQYRSFPGNQTVALYYSKMVNKYLSVPFGPEGNLNLSEAVIHDTLDEGILKTVAKTVGGALSGAAKGAAMGLPAHFPGIAAGAAIGGTLGAIKGAKKALQKEKESNMKEDWSDAKYKSPSGGLTQAGVDAYNRQTGGHLKTAVTTKPSKLKKGSKAANRRKSFCARMGGMKKRLTSAKTARDPDSRINKALRKWNCEESFRQKLAEKRQLREEQQVDENLGLAMNVLRGIGPTALKYGRQAVQAGKNLIGKVKKPATSAAPSGTPTPPTPKAPKVPKKGGGGKGGNSPAIAIDPTELAKAIKDGNKPSASSAVSDAITPHKADLVSAKKEPQMSSSFKMGKDSDEVFASRYKRSLLQKENKISDIQNMLNEGIDNMDLSINGRTITLNNSMAKKIVRVYESVNAKNKKIVENMLNEDLDSFKKLLNFSIKA